jgi:hypothetical protein
VKIKQLKVKTEYKNILKQWRVEAMSRRVVLVVIFIAFQVILVLGSMYYAVQLYISGQVNEYHEVVSQAASAISDPIRVTRNYFSGRMSHPEALTIDFKFEDWQGLVEKHDEAVKANNLFATDNPTFPAKIRINKENIDVRVRLKGGGDHFKRSKWSLRIEVRDDDKTILGMKRFSLQHPATRMYLNEWVMHKLMAREGAMVLPYDFVDVTINGRHQGIYAFEGHFTQELMEWNKRKPGVLLSFDQALDNLNTWQNPWAAEAREIDSYQTSQVIKDEYLADQFIAARSLLEKFRRNELTTCAVFDCEILATYFATLDIMGGQHSLEPGNFKMYYNPDSLRIEPVSFDAETDFGEHELFLQAWASYKTAPESASFIKTIFSDLKFMELYIAKLARMSDANYLNNFWLEIQEEMNNKLNIIYSSYPSYKYDQSGITKAQSRIRNILGAKKALDGYVSEAKGQDITVEVGTVLPFPMAIRGIECGTYRQELVHPVVLTPHIPSKLISHELIQIKLPSSSNAEECIDNGFFILYSIFGQKDIRAESPSLLPRMDQ